MPLPRAEARRLIDAAVYHHIFTRNTGLLQQSDHIIGQSLTVAIPFRGHVLRRERLPAANTQLDADIVGIFLKIII